ncbi:amino acid adenylation domain-containing protein [Tistrella mobilis]|uniref:amino acid adenylation domain-containing protein n=1 Tax=Tistrella mobilis TaxID=171437 RepID=UPI003555C89C
MTMDSHHRHDDASETTPAAPVASFRDKSNVAEIFYLSELQQGMLAHALKGGDDAYHIRHVFEIAGNFDPERFARAWGAVVARHAMLRADIRWREIPKPVHIVYRRTAGSLAMADWRGLDPAAQRARLEADLATARAAGFDFARAADPAVQLIRIADDRWWFTWRFHHVQLDGWSVARILADLLAAYRGEAPAAPAPSFRSHIKWLEGRDLAAADAWWQAELAGTETATPLPPAEGPFGQGHAERIRHLDAGTTAALDRLARRAGATLSTLLQAAWGWLLATHAGTDEALFGVTLSGRPAELDGVEQIAGLFINTLPLRVTLDRSLNVTDWLAAAQRRMNALRPHDHVPLARIRGLAPVVDGPLFDTILVVENFPVDAALGAADGDVSIRVPGPAAPEDGVIATDGRNHYPLSLIAETGPRLKLVLAYDLARYSHDDIARLMAQLVRVLAALPAAADRPLGGFAPFDDMPRRPLPAAPQLLPDHLGRHDPAAVAVVDGARAITYGDLARDAARLAARLGALGVRPGDRVALIAPRSAGFVAAVLGIWRAGAAYVPLDPAAPAARLADQIGDSQARAVIGPDGDLPADPAGWGDEEAPAVPLHPAAEAYVIFTSGSTGRPKGIAVSHGALAAYLDGLVARLALGDDPLRVGWVSTPAADLGHTALFGALRLGAELHIADEARIFDPDRFGAWMADHAIDLIKIVPGHLAALLDAAEPARVLPRRALVLGGEALTAGLAARIAELAPGCRLINHYGPSETTVGVLTDEGGMAKAGRHALGRPLGHAAVRILDRAGNPVAPGMAGEIVIGGATLAHGYVGRPGQTAERFIPDAAGLPGARVYLTGDRGRARDDGRIDFLGRLDDQVKIRGYRVEPEEVATVLRGLPGVAAATVIARPDAHGRLRLLGYAAGSGLDGARLRQALAERLPDALVPAAVMVLDRLPLTPNGKIDRKALPDEPGAAAAAAPAKPAPRTATEAALHAIWCQVLRRDDIGVTDNFFASGGDSILSLQLVARARKAGLKLTPKQVFDQPEIARLAAVIDGAAPAATPAPTARPQAPRLPAAQVAALEALHQSGVGQSLDGVTDILPATPVQRGMIFHTLEAAGRADRSGVYVNQLRLTFRGRVDLDALEAAWAAAIARHPALRTRFEWRHGGDLLQIVHDAAAAPVALFDWSSLPAAAAAARLDDWLADDIARGIDLTRAPAMRLAVFRRPDGGDELVWTNHHAITDGWSTSLVLAELARDYAARVEGGSIDLPAPPHTRAYAAWLAAQPDPEPWWRRQIARINQPALITEALAAPAEATPGHHQLRVLLDPDMTRRLTAAARREQVTLNTLVQGAWALLLGRYAGRDQAVFGVTLAGRPADLPGVEAMAGAFLNTLPLWIDLPGDAAIGPWLRDIQKLNAELRSVEFSSLADVQRWSGLAGEGLFDALLVFQNFPVEAALADLESRLGVTGADAWTRSHYPLELMVVPGDRLDLRWKHDTARLGDAQVAELHRHFLQLLNDLASGAGVLGDLDPLDDDTRRRLIGTAAVDAHPVGARRHHGPAPDLVPDDASADQALEAALVEIWQGVLNRRDIGVTDDFFDLGGDSIMSLQVVARAARAGIRITARQIFDHPRIDRLARAARAAEAAAAEAEVTDTPLPLTPIQAWFFDRHPDGPGHWNQSVLLRARDPIDIAALDRALKAIVARHDALRLRFETDAAGRWRQRVADIETADLLRVARLEDAAALDAAGEAVQASLDIRTGPLLRAGCFSLPAHGAEPGGDRLLIAIHHLAVDGVSWRILLDDLQAAYDAALAGRPIDLPAPPVAWSRHVLRQAARLGDGAALGAELRRWQDHLGSAAPVWGPARSGGRLEQERVVAEAVTRRLLTDVPRCYRITVEEVLLASLARTLGRATGRDTVLVAMEGHGRGEPEEGGEAHDLSRTIGWFTTHYDVALPTGRDESGDEDARLLADLRSRLRSLPARGADRGLLALAADPAIVDAARALPAADIGFNWLGRFDGSLEEGGRFSLGTETAGRNIGRRGPMRHAIEINAAVTDGRLRIGWRHDPAVVAEAVMTRIVEGFETALTELVSHCLTADPIPVAADFPLAALNEDEFNRLQLAPGQMEDIYPATPVQQGLLFHSLRHPGQGVYVNQLRVTLDGTPDIDALGRAFAAAMTRHPVLRTSFDWRHGGTALQLVHRRVTLPIDVHDWSGRAGYEPELADWLAADRARGFDPARAPLMRLALFRRPDGASDLVWTLHHALTDGWSTARLLHEIARDYEAFTDADPAPAGAGIPSPTPYRDYIAWLRRQPDPAPWWQAQAARIADPAGITQVLAPPAGISPGAPVPGSHRLDRPASDALTRAVEALARRERVTLATVLQGAWALLLGRMAGRGQAGFGLTVSGRPADLPGVERMAGPFINSLPLWIDLAPAARLGDWLRDIQKLNVEMRAVEHSSLADIQRLTGRSGDGLFDSLLVIESYPVETAAGATRLGARTRAMSMVERTHYPLVLAAVPGARPDLPGAQLDLRWGWDGARLAGDAVARLADDFLDLLAAFTAPEAARLPLGAVKLAAPVPAPAVIHDVHPVHERFAAIAARMPDREAVACGDRRLDYGQLDRWSSRIARALLAAGVRPETRVGLAVERSVGLVAAILGALRAGAAYVPLDPDYPADRLRHMIADAGLTLLLVGPDAARLLAPVVETLPNGCRLIDVTALDAPDPLDDSPLTVPVLPDQLAYVIYTSGSTGLPKGVGISHAALSRHFDDFIPAFAYGPQDAGLQFSTVNFDAAIEQMLPLLTLGGRVVLRGPGMWSAEELTHVLATERLTIADIPTGFWQHWARDPALHLPHLRRVTVGGEALPPDALARWKAGPLAHVRLDNRYGPTEAAISALYHETRAEDGARPPVPIGRTYPGRSAVILGTDGSPVPLGGMGELCIGGPALARGYLNRPGQTAERFVPDPFGAPGARLYRSGDLCRLREDGVVVFLGRIDAQVKLRGFRIEPGEIEALLRAEPGIDDAVVAVRGDRLLAWVAGDEKIDPI